jgi:hypothetical protein
MPKPENVEPHKFKPGQSGNPAGKPKGAKRVSTVLKELLEKLAPGAVVDAKFVAEFCKGRKRVTNADAAAARLLYEALVKGEPWAMKELIDRTEGKATQPVELGGAEGGPLKVLVEYVGDTEQPHD